MINLLNSFLESEEKILIELLNENSTQAFDALYKRYSSKLYFFILKISNNDQYRSEEIVQNVFVKVWENRHNIDSSKSFNSFISTVAKNMLLNEYNHEIVKYIYRNKVIQRKTDASTSMEDEIEYRSLTKYLNALIEKMPPVLREVYRLSRLEYHTNKEIAKLLDRPESTIEKQLSKANKFISEKVKKHYDKIFIFLLHQLFL